MQKQGQSYGLDMESFEYQIAVRYNLNFLIFLTEVDLFQIVFDIFKNNQHLSATNFARQIFCRLTVAYSKLEGSIQAIKLDRGMFYNFEMIRSFF